MVYRPLAVPPSWPTAAAIASTSFCAAGSYSAANFLPASSSPAMPATSSMENTRLR